MRTLETIWEIEKSCLFRGYCRKWMTGSRVEFQLGRTDRDWCAIQLWKIKGACVLVEMSILEGIISLVIVKMGRTVVLHQKKEEIVCM